MKKKLRPLGHITNDLEVILDEMSHDQDMQHGEVLAIVFSWLLIHAPNQREVYVKDGSSPEFYYGPHRQNKSKNT